MPEKAKYSKIKYRRSADEIHGLPVLSYLKLIIQRELLNLLTEGLSGRQALLFENEGLVI